MFTKVVLEELFLAPTETTQRDTYLIKNLRSHKMLYATVWWGEKIFQIRYKDIPHVNITTVIIMSLFSPVAL